MTSLTMNSRALVDLRKFDWLTEGVIASEERLFEIINEKYDSFPFDKKTLVRSTKFLRPIDVCVVDSGRKAKYSVTYRSEVCDMGLLLMIMIRERVHYAKREYNVSTDNGILEGEHLLLCHTKFNQLGEFVTLLYLQPVTKPVEERIEFEAMTIWLTPYGPCTSFTNYDDMLKEYERVNKMMFEAANGKFFLMVKGEKWELKNGSLTSVMELFAYICKRERQGETETCKLSLAWLTFEGDEIDYESCY